MRFHRSSPGFICDENGIIVCKEVREEYERLVEYAPELLDLMKEVEEYIAYRVTGTHGHGEMVLLPKIQSIIRLTERKTDET